MEYYKKYLKYRRKYHEIKFGGSAESGQAVQTGGGGEVFKKNGVVFIMANIKKSDTEKVVDIRKSLGIKKKGPPVHFTILSFHVNTGHIYANDIKSVFDDVNDSFVQICKGRSLHLNDERTYRNYGRDGSINIVASYTVDTETMDAIVRFRDAIHRRIRDEIIAVHADRNNSEEAELTTIMRSNVIMYQFKGTGMSEPLYAVQTQQYSNETWSPHVSVVKDYEVAAVVKDAGAVDRTEAVIQKIRDVGGMLQEVSLDTLTISTFNIGEKKEMFKYLESQ